MTGQRDIHLRGSANSAPVLSMQQSIRFVLVIDSQRRARQRLANHQVSLYCTNLRTPNVRSLQVIIRVKDSPRLRWTLWSCHIHMPFDSLGRSYDTHCSYVHTHIAKHTSRGLFVGQLLCAANSPARGQNPQHRNFRPCVVSLRHLARENQISEGHSTMYIMFRCKLIYS